jgi:hypothetical protein
MSYRIEYLAPDGEWRTDGYLSYLCSPANVAYLRYGNDLWCNDAECVESAAKSASVVYGYEGVPMRTLYGDSDSPVSVYVNGVNVRDAWCDKDMGHPHLQVTVLLRYNHMNAAQSKTWDKWVRSNLKRYPVCYVRNHALSATHVSIMASKYHDVEPHELLQINELGVLTAT